MRDDKRIGIVKGVVVFQDKKNVSDRKENVGQK